MWSCVRLSFLFFVTLQLSPSSSLYPSLPFLIRSSSSVTQNLMLPDVNNPPLGIPPCWCQTLNESPCVRACVCVRACARSCAPRGQGFGCQDDRHSNSFLLRHFSSPEPRAPPPPHSSKHHGKTIKTSSKSLLRRFSFFPPLCPSIPSFASFPQSHPLYLALFQSSLEPSLWIGNKFFFFFFYLPPEMSFIEGTQRARGGLKRHAEHYSPCLCVCICVCWFSFHVPEQTTV